MPNSIFEINAPGIDTDSIVDEIQKTVADKAEKGCYDDARVTRAERANLANLKDEDGFLSFYLDCLRDAVFVDINDFEIVERRSGGRLLIALKKVIWKLLKFYTYRLWSQQNQVNGLLLTAMEAAENKYTDQIAEMEERITKLEARLNGKG